MEKVILVGIGGALGSMMRYGRFLSAVEAALPASRTNGAIPLP